MYLDLNYTDPTNLSRTVELMSVGYDLKANAMGQKDVCLHAWYQMSGGQGYKSELMASLR